MRIAGVPAARVKEASSRKKILVLAQTPPPFHGQAVMQMHLVDATWDWCEKKHIRLNFSDSIEQVGLPSAKKLWRLALIVSRVLVERCRGPIHILYYPPCGPHRVAFLRDAAILLIVRPLVKRLVLHFHAGGFDQLQYILTGLELLLARRAYATADAAIVLLPSLSKEIDWVSPKHIAVVPNGIEDELGDTQNTNRLSTPVILYVGSISVKKGFLDLIEACGLLRDRGIQFSLCAVGGFVSGEIRSLVSERVRRLNLVDKVDFKGSKTGKDKWEEYLSADVFCFPSYDTENFPVVLLEAMQSGLPIVATRWRAIPELVQENENGLLVPEKDPSALAAALESLLASKPLRERLGKTGREVYLNKYTLTRHLESLQSVFHRLAIAE